MYSMRGADLLIRLLERQGVDIIFGIPGGAILPIYDALAASDSIRHVLARHEQGAGFMAQGLARSTGKTGVVFATSGPGATNVLTALADAKSDSVPLVCITGQVSSGLLGTDAFQEADVYGMSISITKHNFLVRSAEELLSVIPEAFRIAASGRPGPVLVDIPRDVQLAPVEFSEWPDIGEADVLPPPDPQTLEEALAALCGSERPAMMVGGGTAASGAGPKVRDLAERLGIPVAMSLLGLGTLPKDHPLYLGMLGMHGARYTNFILDACDVLLVIGARLDDRATGNARKFCPNARIIHVDIDFCEHGKIRKADIDVVGDAKVVLDYLLERTQSESPDRRKPWLDRVAALKSEYPLQTPGNGHMLTPYGIIRKTAQLVPQNAIIASDVGQHQMRTAQAYPFNRTRTWLSSGGQGTMGFGLPAAIGAAVANPDKTVVCFSGDGSLLMNIQELATAAEQNANVKIILTNNNGLGLIHQMQDLLFDGRKFAWNYETQVDFIRIAKGFGIRGVDLDKAEDPESALAEALNASGPALIHLRADVRNKVYPVVPPGAANTEMIGG